MQRIIFQQNMKNINKSKKVENKLIKIRLYVRETR